MGHTKKSPYLLFICTATQRINIYLNREYISKGLGLYAHASLKNKKLGVILFVSDGKFFDVPHTNLLAICVRLLVVFAHCPASPTYGAKRDVGGDCPSEYARLVLKRDLSDGNQNPRLARTRILIPTAVQSILN